MEIKFRDIVLRDYRESDIDDELRWFSTETAWSDFDAPWEPIEPLEPESFRAEMLAYIASVPPDAVRHRLEIEADGTHIGYVSAYRIDENFEWISNADAHGRKTFRALGIDICESAYWGRGLGTQALAAFIGYFLDLGETELYVQTWSGNERMIRSADKLGFVECRRRVGIREVRGGVYDALTFRLDLEKFREYAEKLARQKELFGIYRRCFPFCVRGEAHARKLLTDSENKIIEKRGENGELIGVSVIHKSNILMLCVDEPHRYRGIGSWLLAESERIIREQGYTHVTVGAGDDYLMPGVPASRPVTGEALQPDRVYGGICDSAEFFRRRGYRHDWDCNCFDMRLSLADFNAEPRGIAGVAVRWAELCDRAAVLACTDDAHAKFTKYYTADALYGAEGDERVLIAEAAGEVAGALLVNFGTEGEGLGSVGCTAVRHAFRGRGIATNLVIAGTKALRDAGLRDAFLGYTYTGLDRMYGAAGYRICVYYYMAKKDV